MTARWAWSGVTRVPVRFQIQASSHLPARDLSDAEAATVARFEGAPDAEESFRMRVANAIVAQFRKQIANGYVSPTQAVDAADAAIAVMRGDDA